MKLDHVAMYVNDLETARDFFIRYFGAVSNEMYHNPRTGLKTYFLSFDRGARLEIMSRPDMADLPKDPCGQDLSTLLFAWEGKKKSIS